MDDRIEEMPYPCPRCKGPLLNFLHTGFVDSGLKRDGVCFQWAEDKFTCNNHKMRTSDHAY